MIKYSAPYHFSLDDLCVVIPTYNNASTICQVVEGCLEQVNHVMVLNDGSTDDTLQVLEPFTGRIILISHQKNQGKGAALRTAFRKAKEMGFRYALTLDADGQHYPTDIPALVASLKENPEALIVGERNVRGQTRGARFANRFSNFWFAVQTARRLRDTQTGLRIYPLRQLPRLDFLTARYEAELELLVWSAWRGVKIKTVPVSVFYPPVEERVSHFKPAKDFSRISLFNTIMLIGAIVYGYPRMLLTWLWRQEWLHYPYIAFKWVAFAFDCLVLFPSYTAIYLLFHGDTESSRQHCRKLFQRIFLHIVNFHDYFHAEVHYDSKENFSTPAMIVSNHQSLVDVLAILSLAPNIIMITKNSFAHHPVFAPFLKYAGFYTVSEGYEKLADKLQEKVKQGWSICIFPEGTRTRTGKIQRFHTGAFFLAERLGIDILPCFVENTFNLWPKGCYFPHHGVAHIHVLPRVNAHHPSAQNGYRHQAKEFERMYRKMMEE